MSGSVRADRLCLWMLLTGAVAPSLTGCGPPATPYPAALQSQRPEERIRAIKRAGETKDRSVIGILVDRLEDEDEAVRLYAILALEKLTGTRLGYDYAAREGERARAVKRWRQYLVREPPAADTHAGVAP